MPRSIWSGALSFGLVNVPVKLYSAVSKKSVRFHQLDREDNTRIQQRRVNPKTGEEVPYERLVKGFEIAPDRYVVITPEELDALDPSATRSIEISEFVDLEEIDPLYFDHPYYLAPGTGAGKSYGLLARAMEEAGKVAIARFVMRGKEYLAAVRAHGGVMTLETLNYADEVVDPGQIDELGSAEEAENASARELAMAKQLIESLTEPFDPARHRDTHREAVLDMIDRKAAGETFVVEAPPEAPAAAPDLMAALEASIAAVKKAQADGDAPAAPKKRAAAKKPAAKKPPAKPRSKAKA